ncbi:POZ-, AT hook-, and zinc finger-containing protein 1-like isoform X2 [Anolis carolinensis]|uniref:POZ-, AT hook-, and zinc finger-containing protein 1-like isoform X2 n=1 Tax=Anolis carolinensis TaxID=28377 RepID=UPI002F2B1DBB
MEAPPPPAEAPPPAPPPSCYTYQVSRHSADLLQGLNQQRKAGGRFCDVLLRVGEESFPAHRAVLAACSEYFESVFGGGGGGGIHEGEGGATSSASSASSSSSVPASSPPPPAPCAPPRELEMHTISSKVFGDILDFAYTSRIVVRLESFPELMTAAKFLLMRSVIDICQEVIKQSNVQILVPPSARPDLMLFRPAAELGFPLDMSNGNGIAGMSSDDGAALLTAFPPPPPSLSCSPGKRGRGRPRKASVLDSVMFSAPGGLREAGILPCGLCGKVFTDANRLRQHEAQHGVTSLQLGYLDLPGPPAPAPPPPPPAEGPGLAQPGSEPGRKRSRTRKQVACEVCGKIFRDVYHLNRHKLSHSGEKPYSCPVCGLRFKRKDRMSYHVRSHDGSVGKPYICQSCGKGFSRPDHLNGHIKQVHTSERPHKCQGMGLPGPGLPPPPPPPPPASPPPSHEPLRRTETCQASFATRDRLRSHLACHEDKVPCQVCGKFLRAAYLADHLKKHSEGPSNFCTICNRGFSSASYLKVHVKTHHDVPLPQVSRQPEPLPNGAGPAACLHSARTYGIKGLKCSPLDPIEGADPDPYGDLPDELKAGPDPDALEAVAAERRFPCVECGGVFRSKAFLAKHVHKAHPRPAGGSSLVSSGVATLADLGASPFSPQQSMSLLESFGFQIVQSAFASSLVDPDADPLHQAPPLGGHDRK